jgi:hypothetical protein
MPSLTLADILNSWGLVNFTVVTSGLIDVVSMSTVNVSETGGNGLTAFKGQTPGVVSFQGELGLVDSQSGIFIFGFDSQTTGMPTAAGPIHGAFLMSPDKNYCLGLNASEGTYFAGSR